MTTLYENYVTGDDVDFYISSTIVIEGQSFTPSISHTITSVKLKLWRDVQATGTLTVGIWATDGTGKPTGTNLCSGTLASSGITTSDPGLWYEITLGAGTILTAGTKYAIIVYCLNLGPIGTIYVRQNCTSPTYGGGNEVYSNNSGSSWQLDVGRDIMFEEWGDVFIPEIDPLDKEINVDIEGEKISWTSYYTSPYNVYFGGTLVSVGQTDTFWNLPALDYDTEYTWYINSEGPWTFHTIPFYVAADRITSKRLVAVAADKIWYEDI